MDAGGQGKNWPDGEIKARDITGTGFTVSLCQFQPYPIFAQHISRLITHNTYTDVSFS